MEQLCGPAFDHYIRTDKSGARPLPQNILEDFLSRGWLFQPHPCDHSVEPADTVLDPFAGSGTTGQVAAALGRNAVLIDLNYQDLQKMRTEQTPRFARTSHDSRITDHESPAAPVLDEESEVVAYA